jgi:hypothetical protein
VNRSWSIGRTILLIVLVVAGVTVTRHQSLWVSLPAIVGIGLLGRLLVRALRL